MVVVGSLDDLLKFVHDYLREEDIGVDRFVDALRAFEPSSQEAAAITEIDANDGSNEEESDDGSEVRMETAEVASEDVAPAENPPVEKKADVRLASTDSDASEGWTEARGTKRRKKTEPEKGKKEKGKISKNAAQKVTFKEVTIEGETLKVPTVPEETATKVEELPPPIVLEKDTDILLALAAMKENGIKPRQPVKETAKGIRILPKNPADFRKTVKLMEVIGVKCHTYDLKEEKEHKRVLKGIPPSVPTGVVEKALSDQGISFKKVTRLGSKGNPASMVLVSTASEMEADKVMKVKEVADIAVHVEEKKQQAENRQCFRCQRFGHVSMHCTHDPRCLKCAGPHRSWDCQQPKAYKPKCANCEGAHIASNWKCPANPRNLEKKQRAPAPKMKEFPQLKGRKTIQAVAGTSSSYRDILGGTAPAKGRTQSGPSKNWQLEMLQLIEMSLPRMLARYLG